MFNIDMLMDQAKSLFTGETVQSLAESVDPSQVLSDAGVDLGALEGMAPDAVSTLLEKAGLDPGILEGGQIETFTSGLFGKDEAG